jgi:multiple sugar transport system substrate-binding protein
MRNALTRRNLVKGAALGAVAAPMINPRTLYAQSGGFNWRRFQGQTLEVSLIRSPRGDLLKRHLAEFEALTGIKAAIEDVPEQQQRQKIVIELNSG